MLKKTIILLSIVVIIIIFFIGIYLHQSYKANVVRDIKSYNDVNILFITKNNLNEENTNFKLFVIKYNLSDKYIKVFFIDENITILQKSIKSRTLNEMILSVQEDKRIDFVKTEIEKLLDNKIKINYYVSTDTKNINNTIKLLSKGKDTENNLYLLDNYLKEDNDRIKELSSSIKLINYIKTNISLFKYINFIKSLKNSIVVLKTNFSLKDIFFLYKYLKEDKEIRYADIPVLHKRKRLETDEANKDRIINFLNNNNNQDNKLKLQIFNATNKSRLALKATNKIREHNFDVIEWKGYNHKYDFTIIFDLVDNYEQMKEIKKILNCGEIIFVPNKLLLTDTMIFLGQDCKIYDKLDRYGDDDEIER
jgi:hypothetical protein